MHREHAWREYTQRLFTALFSAKSSLLILVMIALIGVFWALLSDTGFMSSDNFMNIVKAKTPVIVMAVASVFVISAGEIDLSVASVPPVAGILAATLLTDGYDLWVGVAAALAAGVGIGLINGAITVLLGIPSFIVTLGMIGALQGAARLISGEQAIPFSISRTPQYSGKGALARFRFYWSGRLSPESWVPSCCAARHSAKRCSPLEETRLPPAIGHRNAPHQGHGPGHQRPCGRTRRPPLYGAVRLRPVRSRWERPTHGPCRSRHRGNQPQWRPWEWWRARSPERCWSGS